MKKILLALLIFGLMLSPCYGADNWLPTEPAGSQDASDIDTLIITNNEASERLNHYTRNGMTIIEKDAASVYAMPGGIAIGNAAGTVYRWREITSATAVTWAMIDTGSEATSTQYYVYAVADVADSASCTFCMSTHATTPTGKTYYRKIGYFYNNASDNIINAGNIDVNPMENSVDAIGTTDIADAGGSYADMDDMIVYYVSNGRPLKVEFEGTFTLTQEGLYVLCDIGGTDKSPERVFHSEVGGAYTGVYNMTYIYYEPAPTAGPLTIKMEWKGTGHQNAATDGTDRKLTVWEP